MVNRSIIRFFILLLIVVLIGRLIIHFNHSGAIWQIRSREVAGILIQLFIVGLAFLQYFRNKSKLVLLNGLAFLAAVILDIFHISLSINAADENLTDFVWDIANTILVVMLVGDIWFWYREDVSEEHKLLQKEILERQRTEATEHEQRQLAEAFLEIGNALNRTLDFNELFEVLLDQIVRVMPYDTANVMLVQGDEVEIVVTRGYGPYKNMQLSRRFALKDMRSLQYMKDTGQPLIIPDTAVSDMWVNAEVSPHVKSWAGAPINVKGELIAFLALNNSIANTYRPDHTARLTAFAGQAASAFENARLFQEVNRRIDELTSFNKISQAITSTLDLQKTLTLITVNIRRLLKVDAASVVLRDDAQGDLWFAAASGAASEFVMGKRLPLGKGVMGWVAESGQPLLVPDTSEDSRYFGEFDNKSGFFARSILCVPLVVKGQTIGAIEGINKHDGTFDEEDLRLLTRLALPAATAIENARLFEQAQQEIVERKRAENALEEERALLARRVEERTADLRAANAQLARAARLKDEFLASISHELRTPLNAILGISEALREEVYGSLNLKQNQSLQSVEESGRHLLELINDILDLSKVEAGKLDVEIVPIPLESVCRASLRLIKQSAHKKRLKLHFSYDNSVTTINADERRTKQILVNLLSNAVKFTPEGGEIGLDVVGDSENRIVTIVVWDTGIGIAEKDMERLFDPFVQLDSRLAREYTGTGLGLSLVSRMMALHNGSVSVESVVGEGSRFTISFPWQGPDSHLVQDQADMAEIPYFPDLRQALLVDDSPQDAEKMVRYLRELGIDTITVTNGREAIDQARQMRPDFILLDIMLPDMPGWDVIAALKEDGRTAAIPVIVVSVLDDQEQATAAGAASCLLKPVSRPQLYQALRQFAVEQEERANGAMKDDLTEMPVLVENKAESEGTAVPETHSRILLAEDNRANITTFTSYLAVKGFEVTVAHDGLEAIAMTKSDQPDLIVMDIQMPKMNGLDAIRAIRADEAIHDIPIIAVTALAMAGDEEACLAAGANAYLSKPVRLVELVETINMQLNLVTEKI
ncbi:MAG: response regulator [Chloroflexi bacterium]|nr:response regulator [Chloroflexota bacterium]